RRWVTTAADCDSVGGIYRGDNTTCTPNPCLPPPPTGACCTGTGGCVIQTQAECEGAGRTYLGDNTTCSPNPCPQPTGACCFINGACRVTNSGDCGATGGVYQGNNTSCTPGLCPRQCNGQLKGDSNCDSQMNNFDIDCFVLALTQGQGAWQAACNQNGC